MKAIASIDSHNDWGLVPYQRAYIELTVRGSIPDVCAYFEQFGEWDEWHIIRDAANI